MNISAVPQPANITNNSAVRGQTALSQLESKASSIPVHCADVVVIDHLLPTGGDYSAEDALQYQWLRTNTFNVNDVLNGAQVSIGITTPPDGFLEKLRQEGLGDEVDWYKLGFDFQALDPGDLKDNVDYIASRYAVLKEHITTNFTGEEQLTQLEKLEKSVGAAKESLAREFADRVGGFLEENGSSGEKEKIYNSILDEFGKKAKQYTDFIGNNKDYARVLDTNDGWLAKDDAYMAVQLRSAVNAAESKPKSSEGYSMKDLTTIGKMVNEMEDYNRYRLNCNIYDEESIGFTLGVLALKADTVSKNSGVSKTLAAVMKKAVDGFVKSHIDLLDEDLAKRPRSIASDEKGYSPLDKGDALAVYDKIMSAYEKTADASGALRAGAAFGKAQHDAKVQSGKYLEFYRYGQEGSMFWTDFYSLKNHGAYDKPTSERVTNTWNSFMRQFGTGDNLSLQLEGHDFSKYA